eukprot:TRINITY_DN5476_c0_g3_i1.p1 TRINITY_DN5476_c0_g3~~TRINITY_DN5476_c0_g3_i1.p1  ORF type:complete len:408 (-),score=47.46 TRINITY_DN5476_c0_g3_i1:480-1703(-)
MREFVVNSIIIQVCCLSLIFVGINSVQSDYELCSTENKLVKSVILVRHAEDTPTHKFPFEKLRWPWGEGVLTVEGMIRAFNLGKLLAEAVNDDITPENMTVFAGSDMRLEDTANSLLLGMFYNASSKATPKLYKCLMCRPTDHSPTSIDCLQQCMNLPQVATNVPLVTISQQIETAIDQTYSCKGFEEWIEYFEKTPGFEFAEEVRFLNALKVLQNVNGGKKKLCSAGGDCVDIGLDAAKKVWENLNKAIAFGEQYTAKYTNEELYSILNPPVQFYERSLYTLSQGPFAGGILLQYIIDMLKGTEQGSNSQQLSDKPVVLFFGHRHSLAGLMAAMGGLNGKHLPDFCSSISFFVYEQGCQNTLEIHYDGVLFGAAGCETGSCELTDFIAAASGAGMPLSGCKDEEVV